MRKNKMMRLASGLLVLTLLTTCMISGTFAKYVTEATGSDEARVAKWGVTVTAQGAAFSTTYQKTDNNYKAENTVIADVKVVAPGTSGTLTDISVTGTPEVAARVSYDSTLTLEGWTLENDEEYCPIVFTVENVQYKVGTGADTNDVKHSATINDLKTAVETAIEACAKDYPANVAINTTTDAPSISWEWPFNSEDDVNDTKDTYLGNVAAGKVQGKTAPTVTLEVTTTVTQVD